LSLVAPEYIQGALAVYEISAMTLIAANDCNPDVNMAHARTLLERDSTAERAISTDCLIPAFNCVK